MKTISLIISIAALAGCASTGDYQAYLAAQQAANETQQPRPILLLEGYENQPITGLKRVEVNLPGHAPVIQQARPNEWAAVVGQGLGVIGTIGGIWAGGEAAKGLAGAVGNAAGRGYQYIQAPAAAQPNYIINGTGVIGQGSYSTQSVGGSGVIGTGTLNSVGGTGAAGGNYQAPIDNSNQGNPVNNFNQGNPTCTTGPC